MSIVYDAQAPGQKLSRVSALTPIYDCFPSVASDGAATAVAVWRQGSSHASDPVSDPVCRVTKDRGKTWSPITVMVPRAAGDPARSVIGVTWAAKQSLWIALLMEATTDSKGNAVRSSRLIASKDGVTWAPYGNALGWPAVQPGGWVYPSDILWVDDGSAQGQLLVAAYAWRNLSTEHVGVIFVIASGDAGQTWTDTQFFSAAAVGNAGLSEPRFAESNGTVYLAMRCDQIFTIFMASIAIPVTPGTWTSFQAITSSASGEPGLFVTREGTFFLACRDHDRMFVGDTYQAHMPFKMLRSDDGGQTWTSQGDRTQTGKASMYQGWCEFGDGSLLLVYGVEDDPSRMWSSASTYAMLFTPESITAVVGTIAGGLPVVRVNSGTGVAYRQGQDGLWEQVRNVVQNGLLVDAEAPSGTVTYAPSLRNDAPKVTVRVPSPQAAWLVVPDSPESSVMLRHITQDGMHSWDAKRFVTSTDIPGAEAPFTIDHGTQGRTGTITTQCLDGLEYEQLVTALESPGAKKLVRPSDYWPLARVPDWVWVIDAPETARGIHGQLPFWEIAISLVPATRPMVTQIVTSGWASLPVRWSMLPSTWAALK